MRNPAMSLAKPPDRQAVPSKSSFARSPDRQITEEPDIEAEAEPLEEEGEE